MSKVNKGFLNFVNKKKYIKTDGNFDLDNDSETKEQEEIQTSKNQTHTVKTLKTSENISTLKESEIVFLNVSKNDNNLNDGSLKSLLERFSGKVIEKEQPKLIQTKSESIKEDEESESRSESESEKNSDSEESDYEEERYNHFIKNRLDLVQNTDEADDLENYQADNKPEGFYYDNSNSDKKTKNDLGRNSNEKNTFSKVESEIFVDNIPLNLHEKQIIKMLKNSNRSISRVKVLKDQNGRHKGKAYLKFSNKNDALNLVKRGVFLDNTRLNVKLVDQSENPNNSNQNNNQNYNKFNKGDLSINGKNQQQKRDYNLNYNNNKSKDNNEKNEKQEFNKFQSSNSMENKTTVFVRNLPSEVDEKLLKLHLKKFGKIKSIRLMKNSNGKNKNFGYVDFLSAESVDEAAKHKDPIIIDGKQLVLEKAKSSFDGGVYEEGKRLGKKKRRSLMNKGKE